MNTNTIDPTTLLSMIIWFVIIIVFIIYRCRQTEKELLKYMDDKMDEYINELRNRRL